MENDVKSVELKAVQNNTVRFNWKAFVLWIISLIVSLLPLYISFFRYLFIHDKIDIVFWNTVFVKSDVLWVFSTVLLFALVDSFSVRTNHDKKWIKTFRIIGLVLLMFSEAIWILISNIEIPPNVYWPLRITIFLIVFLLIISAPLRVSFIRKEG